jgi:hypothetical protein
MRPPLLVLAVAATTISLIPTASSPAVRRLW